MLSFAIDSIPHSCCWALPSACLRASSRRLQTSGIDVDGDTCFTDTEREKTHVDREIAELLHDLHGRLVAQSVAIKALLQCVPTAAEMVARYADASPWSSMEPPLTPAEAAILERNLRALLPGNVETTQ